MESMIFIPEAQSSTVLDMPTALEVVRQAFQACQQGQMYPGDRIAMALPGEKNAAQWLTAVSTLQPYFGYKFSAVFAGNGSYQLPCDQSTISLFSSTTGQQLALIGANYLTALKTGAAAGVATDLLASKQASHLGVIGTGIQAYTQVLAIQEVRPLEELRIFDLSTERAEAFAQRIREGQNRPYPVILCEDADRCVRESDILCTVTPSRQPVFQGAALKAGTHLNAIGSFTPFMQELPEEAVVRSDLVVTEHVEGLWATAGDILIPFEKGLFPREKVVGSVGDLLAGTVAGRQAEQQVTLYESVGSCVLDLAIAIRVYEKWKEKQA